MSTSQFQDVLEQEKKPPVNLQPSPGFAAWLNSAGGSLVFSTYQSARVFFVSASPDNETIALERIVGSAMGLAVDRDKLWISNKEQVWCFANTGQNSITRKTDPITKVEYDAVFVPRWGIFIGPCDTHDLISDVEFEGKKYELLFANTAFSCIASIDKHYNFNPIWKPSFISEISPGDRCHLNGIGARDGNLAYATACGETNEPLAWKSKKSGGGILIDIQKNEIITRHLSMPHSPRWHDGKIWLLNSGDGQLGYVDPESGKFSPTIDCPGFARGLTIIGNHAIIGVSRLRENTFSSGLHIKEKLELSRIPQRCCILIANLKTGEIEHWLDIEGKISELYDVAWLPGIRRPFTPGFNKKEPLQRIVNIPCDRFPVAP